MGEGFKQMLSSSYRAEDDEELGETSSLSGGESDDDVAAGGEEYASSSLPPKNSDRSLDELSSLVSQLPLKRGLSKYYQGKSQSFSSFSDVGSVGDLAKKETPYKRKMMKTCRSYAGGLDEHNCEPSSAGDHYNKSITTVPKKASTNSRRNGACAPLIASTSSLFSSGHGKPPLIPIQTNI
ncbi:Uncharacterized protein M6B38_230120 [Iris pallida]|uniref:Oxidative stress 3 n=1 Tax=Iris pallida TaxID=29817 RepID=A0AAX6DSG2_IRIPA|nr:Uncharacterized protein M6B38_230120 [Iris pallida]